ncbi:hypothetical protein SDC9_61811 [bioreactor metagenome]|uniref:Uncharacterized protein n=1 Tax=bioreactor metagenome TaxID=1076179 RepID=A0A644XGT1_9ZZZZ
MPVGDVADGKTVDHHAAPSGLHLAGKQLDNRGFAGAGGADQKDELAVLNGECNAPDGLRAVVILHFHVLQTDHIRTSLRSGRAAGISKFLVW